MLSLFCLSNQCAIDTVTMGMETGTILNGSAIIHPTYPRFPPCLETIKSQYVNFAVYKALR